MKTIELSTNDFDVIKIDGQPFSSEIFKLFHRLAETGDLLKFERSVIEPLLITLHKVVK